MENWHVHSNNGVFYDHDHSQGELQDAKEVHSHGHPRSILEAGFDFDGWERMGRLPGNQGAHTAEA